MRMERDRDGFDAFGRWVGLGVGAELTGEAEVKLLVDVAAQVWGPHARERLCNSA
jgi:hypothetical protein